MRIITYARVSTVKQSDRGKSLIDQEAAFSRAIEQHGWHRVRAYAEAASAKTVEGRATFLQMAGDLDETRPDVVVVHTLDRFTRNLRDGLNELESLRGRGVKLLALDWDDMRPIDMDVDSDWARVVDAFTTAEKENRNRARRIRLSYAGRSNRGETTVQRPCYGLLLADGKLVPHGDRAWIWPEINRRVLDGMSLNEVLRWAQSAAPDFYRTRTGLTYALRSRSFVAAELRTGDEQAAIDARLDALADVSTRHRKHEHEFTGVFECALCGMPLVGSSNRGGGDGVQCSRRADGPVCCSYTARLLRPAWVALLQSIDDDGWAEAFIAQSAPAEEARVALQRRLTEIEQDEARLAKRRDAALDLYAGAGPSARSQVEEMLSTIGADARALEVARQIVRAELDKPVERVDPDAIRQQIRTLLADYGDPQMTDGMRNRLNRTLVVVVGERPRISRDKANSQGNAGAAQITWLGRTEATLHWRALARRQRAAPE